VDDEAAVRNLIKAALSRSGDVVDGIGDPYEALDQIKRTTYDVLFLDIRMPGMSGSTLYNEIKARNPDLADHVIIITGDTCSEDIVSFLKLNHLPSLSKPFDIRAVREKLNDILKKDSGSSFV
jgi:DNA-binding NtrC family response regulator